MRRWSIARGNRMCGDRYHSKEDITASWQAKMFRNGDFDIAAKQYREFYNRLKSCYLTLADGSSIYLKGDWEAPTDEKSFTVSTFRLATTDLRYSDLKIELEILYQLDQWAVNINVVSKKKDTLQAEGDAK
jgi:DNA modification methylase